MQKEPSNILLLAAHVPRPSLGTATTSPELVQQARVRVCSTLAGSLNQGP